MSLVLAFDDWPTSDRSMWNALMATGGPLDDLGPLSHLRETSRTSLQAHYGRWLAWLLRAQPDVLTLKPADRVTPARLGLWLEDLAHTRPMSRWSFVADLLRIVVPADPHRDWRDCLSIKARLKKIAGRGDQSRKAGRVLGSDVLLEAGVAHATVAADAATTELEAMKRRRNGTMVALLAIVPMRRRAYANLELGTSLVVGASTMWVSLPPDLTKTGQPWECEVPQIVAPLVRTYITEVRPWFLARGNRNHDILWVGDRGAPFEEDHFGVKIAGITLQLTGKRVPPHFFRDAAATTLSRLSPDAARLIRPVLAHASFGTAERHYVQAMTIEAGRDYAALIKARKKGV